MCLKSTEGVPNLNFDGIIFLLFWGDSRAYDIDEVSIIVPYNFFFKIPLGKFRRIGSFLKGKVSFL